MLSLVCFISAKHAVKASIDTSYRQEILEVDLVTLGVSLFYMASFVNFDISLADLHWQLWHI